MVRICEKPPRRIVVFRALKLGDMLCSVPALRALRNGFPEAEIVLVGLPWAREFADRYHYLLDGFREFPGYPGLPEREPVIDELPRFFGGIQAELFDISIQLHGSGSISNIVTARFGARVNAGFHDPDSDCPDLRTFLPYPNRGLEIRRLLRLMEHLGIPSCGESLDFPIEEADRLEARQLAHGHGFEPHHCVCVHAGASVPERQWPIERFASVAGTLSAHGFTIVLTGSAHESRLTSALARAIPGTVVDLAGKTALGPLAAMLSQSRLLICNDTGVSHLADALRIPSVVISTGDNPERWAPADRRLHRVLCHPSGVRADEVIRTAEELLNNGSCRAA